MALAPVYTASNCNAAYQLNWSLSIFWKVSPPSELEWLEALKNATENDHVRILEHRTRSRTSEFLLSTKPHVPPSAAIRSVKGRLQYLLREINPRCFRRNYFIGSVGSINANVVDSYVANQAKHHPMADLRSQMAIEASQFGDPTVELTVPRRSDSGEFIYNLHLVVVRKERLAEVRQETLDANVEAIRSIAMRKQHLLSRVGVAADHLHLTLGGNVTESPEEIALSYLNNLAYKQGMEPIFQFGYYAGTFGPYDLQAIRRSLAMSAL